MLRIWEDNDNQDGIRPGSITINLLADGEKIDSKTVTEDDDWAWEFAGLPKNKVKGEAIEYTVTEDVVADYVTTYEGNDVINTYAPGKTGVKTGDNNNILIPLAVMLSAMLGLLIVAAKRRKNA